MRAYICDQGGEVWHSLRGGRITASMFEVARQRVGELNEQQSKFVDAVRGGMSDKAAAELAGYKAVPKSETIAKAIRGEPVGDWSEAAKNYAFRIAIERIAGKPLDDGFETWQMRRGHELEPEARMEHEIKAGVIVEKCGFVTTEDDWFGASADGFVGNDEGCEYKCFLSPEKLRAFWMDNDASCIMDQVQGGLWITGRKRWHVGLYCPALEPAGKQLWLHTYDRDEAYIERLESDLLRFRELVMQYESRLRA